MSSVGVNITILVWQHLPPTLPRCEWLHKVQGNGEGTAGTVLHRFDTHSNTVHRYVEGEQENRRKDTSAIYWRWDLTRELTKYKQLHWFFILALHIIWCDNKAVIQPTVSPHQLPNLKVCIWKSKKKSQGFPPTSIERASPSSSPETIISLQRVVNLIQNIQEFRRKRNKIKTLCLYVATQLAPQNFTLEVPRAEKVSSVIVSFPPCKAWAPTVFVLWSEAPKGMNGLWVPELLGWILNACHTTAWHLS